MKWITIKEATTLVKKSNQALYKLSEKEEYKNFFKKENNIKYVDSDFIIDYYSDNKKQPIIEEENENKENKIVNTYDINRINELNKVIDDLRKDKEKLYKQLEIKDKQIETLTEDKKITQEQLLQLLNQQQHLQLQAVERISNTTKDKDIDIEQEVKTESKGFFNRLFNR